MSSIVNRALVFVRRSDSDALYPRTHVEPVRAAPRRPMDMLDVAATTAGFGTQPTSTHTRGGDIIFDSQTSSAAPASFSFGMGRPTSSSSDFVCLGNPYTAMGQQPSAPAAAADIVADLFGGAPVSFSASAPTHVPIDVGFGT